jgi:hypothetical protein
MFVPVGAAAGQGYVEALTPEQQHQVRHHKASCARGEPVAWPTVLSTFIACLHTVLPQRNLDPAACQHMDCQVLPFAHTNVRALTTTALAPMLLFAVAVAHSAVVCLQAFLSRLLLMLGSFVIMCLLLF